MRLTHSSQSAQSFLRKCLEPKSLGWAALTTVLMFTGFLQLSAKAYGQNITLSKKNADLSEIFMSIYQQTGYYFLYKDELLKDAKTVTIEVKDATIQEVLKIIFEDQPLTFSISDHVIVVKRKPNKIQAKDALIEVRGRVLNDKGEPLEGADVFLNGTNKGTQTDANGDFVLKVEDNNAGPITISFAGYVPKVVALRKGVYFTIILPVSSNPLDQVQVIAYGTTSKRLNTGSVSTISSETIGRQPVSNPLEAIEGRMPGVYVQQTSGVSGGGFNIEIRGLNSLRKFAGSNNGNLPLYIIDGVPFTASSLDQNTGVAGQIIPLTSPLNSINPSDIESIEVLKDADATAIYGSRGANGVVLITTKQGKIGKTNVNVSAASGGGKVTRMMPLLSTSQYLAMRHEAFSNDGMQPDPTYDYDLNGQWDTTRYTDWQKMLFGGTAPITNLQASISGGSATTQFLIGGGYFKQGTVFPGSFSDQKGSLHINMNHFSENKKFDAKITASYAADFNNLPNQDPTSMALNLAPEAPPVYNADHTLNWANNSWQNFTNPMSLFLQSYHGNTNNLIANLTLSYHILPELQLRLSNGYSYSELQQTGIVPISAQNPAFSPTGHGSYSSSNSGGWIIEPQMEFERQISKGKLNVLAGMTFQSNISQDQSLFATGFASDILINNISSAPNVYVSASDYAQYRYTAFFGRINYNWENKYLINISGRRDGSSRFGPGNQFANFGAVGAGWIFSKESLVHNNIPILSFGKLRGSYGTTGSDQIGDYGYLNTYTSTQFPYNGTPGLTVSRLFNPNFAWESNKKAEIALDLGFLNDRFFFETSFFHNQSSNQLVGYPLPAITGQSSLPFYNLPAKVVNKGWEFEIRSTNVKTKYFNWKSSFNLTIPRNKLVSYPNLESSSYANIYEVGKSLYLRKAFHGLGVNPKTGIYEFEDVNHDQEISYPSDLLGIKEVGRAYYGGIDNTFIYKNLELDVFIQFVKQTGSNYLYFFPSPGTLGNQPTTVLNRWQNPGDIAAVQKYSQDYSGAAINSFYNISNADNYISDASFVRLKNIYLSYQLSREALKRLKIKNLKIYLQGQNLITFTHYIGLDPENQSFGSIPPLKIFTAGIQITL